MVGFATPWIAHLDKSDSCAILVCELFHTQDSVSMSLGKSLFISLKVVVTIGTTLNDIVVLIGCLQGFP